MPVEKLRVSVKLQKYTRKFAHAYYGDEVSATAVAIEFRSQVTKLLARFDALKPKAGSHMHVSFFSSAIHNPPF